jgi:hypothetical protein
MLGLKTLARNYRLSRRDLIVQPRVGRLGDLPWVRGQILDDNSERVASA